MNYRQRVWPRCWLMTDERIDDRLWEAIERLPDGEAGIVFRHYRTDAGERTELGRRVAEACRSRSIALAVAGDERLARSLGAHLIHNPFRIPVDLAVSMAVHSVEEAEAARDAGAALVFVSPVHSTRSHPGAKPLGPTLALEIARVAGVPAIALGGMNAARFADIRYGFHGWAAIDAWLG